MELFVEGIGKAWNLIVSLDALISSLSYTKNS